MRAVHTRTSDAPFVLELACSSSASQGGAASTAVSGPRLAHRREQVSGDFQSQDKPLRPGRSLGGRVAGVQIS